ncbi:hypothetical protein [Pseudomonas sp. 22 E 5]|nr:hypothetical protein [Pseudomonas sp. 22 E 5]
MRDCPTGLGMPGCSYARSYHDAVQRADRRRCPGLYGHYVRHRLLRRSPPRAVAAANACLGIQPVAGRLLHQLDLLRRRRPGRRAAVGVFTDLPGTCAAAGAGTLGAAEDDPDQQAGKHHLHCRLYRRTLRQIPITGRGGGTDLPGRRAALYRPATQRHRAGREPVDRLRPRHHRHPRPGHRIDRVAGIGAVHHCVRYP